MMVKLFLNTVFIKARYFVFPCVACESISLPLFLLNMCGGKTQAYYGIPIYTISSFGYLNIGSNIGDVDNNYLNRLCFCIYLLCFSDGIRNDMFFCIRNCSISGFGSLNIGSNIGKFSY